jgi:RHS repeat-associated protein
MTTLTDESSQNFTFVYDIANRLISRTMPNGITSTFDYDGMSRLTRLKHQSASATLFDNQYNYNSASQISQIAELTQTKNFTYDNIDRLTSMTNGSANENYVFDGVGNRTSSHRSASYGYQPFNRLTSTATSTQNFDANGNTVSKSEGSNFWRYGFDYENRMYSASTRKQTVRYSYDALGRRVGRSLANGRERTKFTYDGQDVLVDDNAGTLTKYLNGTGIDNKLRQTVGSTTNYFLADHLGSTNGLTNSSGGLTASNSYDSFGNPTNTGFSSRYQFTGREYDPFSGLQFSRARFYDPNLGRFISEDPIGFGGGDVNLFGYVRNNPQNWRDPLGLCPFCYWGDNPYDIIPEAGWTGIGYAGTFSAGFGDTVSFGVTRYVRQAMGTDDVIDPCSGLYFAGEVTGTVLPLFAGGAGAIRGATVMGGVRGGRLASLGRGAGRFIRDPRGFKRVSEQYWDDVTGFGPANGRSLHHWFTPQREGGSNAGWNLMVVPGRLNSWMGYSLGAGRTVEKAIKFAVPSSLAGGVVAGGYWGLQRDQWKSECGCK